MTYEDTEHNRVYVLHGTRWVHNRASADVLALLLRD